MVECDQSPVGDNSRDTLLAFVVFMDDEVLDSGGVHHNDVGHSKDTREEGRSEESGVFHDDICTFVLVWHFNFPEEPVGRFTDDLATDWVSIAC